MNKFFFAVAIGSLATASLFAGGQQDGRILEHFSYQTPLQTVEIQTDRHDVSVTEGKSEVSGRLIGEASDEYDIKVEGTKLIISISTKKFLFWGSHRPGVVEIKVPKGLNFRIVTASGDVKIKTRTEKASVLTASGRIIAEDGGTAAQLETASGDITAAGFESVLKAVSYSGNLDVGESKGSIDLNSLSGDIRAKSIAGIVVISSTSGEVRVENSSGNFQIMSVSGSLKADSISLDGKNRFSTTSGDIDLDVTNDKEEFSFTGSSVSGSVSAWGKNGSPLRGGSGKIELNVNSVSGSLSIR